MAVNMRAWWPAICPSARIQPRVRPGRVSRAAWAAGGGGQHRDGGCPAAGREVNGHLDGDLLLVDGQGQAGDAGLLDERGGGAQGVRLGGQRPGGQQACAVRAGGDGHVVIPLLAVRDG